MKIRLGQSVVAISALLILFTLTVTPAVADSYNNGPLNGTSNAWIISSGSTDSVADSFTVSSATTVTSFSAGLWVFAGDTPTSVSWAITTGDTPNFCGIGGSTPCTTGTASVGALTLSNLYLLTNQSGFDIYNSTVTGLSVPLAAGTTYWLELFNLTTAGANLAGWDINNGPSTAYQNNIGNLDGNLFPGTNSDTFTINPSATPEPGTMLMFGTGALGLLGAIRRRFSI